MRRKKSEKSEKLVPKRIKVTNCKGHNFSFFLLSPGHYDGFIDKYNQLVLRRKL